MKSEVIHESEYIREETMDFGTPFGLRRRLSYDEYDESFYVIDSDFDKIIEVIQSSTLFNNYEKDVYGKTLKLSSEIGFSLVYKVVGMNFIVMEVNNSPRVYN